jgi:hypothetical protein
LPKSGPVSRGASSASSPIAIIMASFTGPSRSP